MFEKLLAVLPYNPSLIHQMSFYSRRMRAEASIRRIGLVFIILTFMVQFFAVLSPPKSTSADSCDSNSLISCGLDPSNPAADALNKCKNDVQGYGNIMRFYGISCDAFKTATVVGNGGIHSTPDNNYYSMGHNLSSGTDSPRTIPDSAGDIQVYWRLLSTFGDQAWPALHVHDYEGTSFYVIISCGNLVSVGIPAHNQLPAPLQGSDDLILNTLPPTGPAPTPTPSPTPTPPPTGQPEAPPKIGINTATCTGGITGWASEDLGNSPEPILVDVWVDGPAGGAGATELGNFHTTGTYPANNPNFTFAVPPPYNTGTHVFWVYAINASGVETGPNVNNPNVPGPQRNVYGNDGDGTTNNSGVPLTLQANCSGPPPTCQYNSAIPADSAQCFPPCQYNTAIAATSPQCAQPCQYNVAIAASSAQCFPPCKFNPSISANSSKCFQPCQYNTAIPSSDSTCKACATGATSTDTLPCITIHKTATNVTAGIADANNTTANPGDTITYTLYAQNNAKDTVKQYVFQENLSDVMDYADPTDLHGGTIDSGDIVTWPPQDIAVGQTATVQVSVKVKNPIPQTPASSTDPMHFDLTMTNVYGNTINIKVPAPVAVSVQTAAAVLPNTGPGASLFVAALVVMVIAYFYSRARLLARESTLAAQETATSA
jgi:uncharacterized repeat protein (TIGR01451 family)